MVVVACCCCILYRLALMLAPTFAPCILTFATYILTWTLYLYLWCFPSFNWCKHSTCTGGGYHQLQLALVVHFHSATSTDSPLAHVVASPSATCAGGAFSFTHWRKYFTCTRATCTVWWWPVVVVYLSIYLSICYIYSTVGGP